MPETQVADIGFYYETRGERDPFVLIMGLGGGSSLWWKRANFFSAELALFEGAGHGYLSEGEEEANRVVHGFFKRHPIPPVN